MSVPVKLSEMLQAMNAQLEDEPCYLDLSTGRIEKVSKHDLRAARNPDRDGAPVRPCPELDLARQIQSNRQNFLLLPTPHEIHEYSIMEQFIHTIDDGWMQEILFAAITGPGAFRRFKTEARKLGVDDEWFEYRQASLRQIALQWCSDNEVDYIEA